MRNGGLVPASLDVRRGYPVINQLTDPPQSPSPIEANAHSLTGGLSLASDSSALGRTSTRGRWLRSMTSATPKLGPNNEKPW
jgi:hypothetical protein